MFSEDTSLPSSRMRPVFLICIDEFQPDSVPPACRQPSSQAPFQRSISAFVHLSRLEDSEFSSSRVAGPKFALNALTCSRIRRSGVLLVLPRRAAPCTNAFHRSFAKLKIAQATIARLSLEAQQSIKTHQLALSSCLRNLSAMRARNLLRYRDQ